MTKLVQFDQVIDNTKDDNEIVFIPEEDNESDGEVNLPVDLKSFLSCRSNAAFNKNK